LIPSNAGLTSTGRGAVITVGDKAVQTTLTLVNCKEISINTRMAARI